MVEPLRLRKGKEFEKEVVNNFITHTKDGHVSSNNTITLSQLRSDRGKRGRPDIFIDELGDFVTILEIKATDWDLIKPKNVKKNLWRHQRQLFKYVDKYLDEQGCNVCLGVIYPKPPKSKTLRREIESYLENYGTPAYWYTEIKSS